MKIQSIWKISFLSFALIFFIQSSLWAQKETIGVTAVKPTQAILQNVDRAGKKISLDRVLQSMNGQLIDRINATRKFQVVARSDLDDILKEQDFASSGNVDLNDKSAAQQFKIAGVKYLVVTTVDDFQDYNEVATFQGTGRSATKRVIRLSCVGKIYDSTTGKLLESTNFQISNKDVSENKTYSVRDSNLNEDLLVAIAREMSVKIANRVTDVIFPPKVLSKRDKQITINRGDGTDIAVGQIWNVFALGEELIDPDTKESLGREEILIGKVKIIGVLPKTSTAEIIEDLGIDKEAVLRKAL
ncbi:MAG: CsgG/HfaB family protein [Candidatus Brocadiaceae bacterium]|uniref:CsgG/HfaB family protein n=1 Tax=Candidatus Wunengus sp. YC61 TaxID=3367698 RepID=UPI00271DE580|nr:CsgG/HfaB family protein [Candidatus Brocadiaceae bacterium]